MKYLVYMFIFLLSACHFYTIDDYRQEVLGKYYGANIETLVLGYGSPTNIMPVGNIVLVVYEDKSTSYIPRSYTTNTTYDTYSAFPSSSTYILEHGGYSVEEWCKAVFYLKNGKVFDVKFWGNNCIR